MIYKNTKIKIYKKVSICVLTLLFAIVPFFNAKSTSLEDIRKEIEQRESEKSALDEKISQYESEINELQEKGKNLENQIKIIEDSIKKTETEIEATQKDIEKVQLEIDKLTQEILRLEEEIRVKKNQLAEMLREMSQRDKVSAFEMFLKYDSFSSFVDNSERLELVEGEVQQILDQIQKLKVQIETKRAELQVKKDEFIKLKKKLEREKGRLESQKKMQEMLLEETKQEESKYQELLKAEQEDQSAIEDEISRLQEEARQKLEEEMRRRQQEGGNPPEFDGDFVWPLHGIITAYFHDPTYPFGIHNGMDIATDYGTPVVSATDGVVIHAGWQDEENHSRGYGYYVAIASGDYLIMYGHCADDYPMYYVPGENAEQGDTICHQGSSGFSTGPHLHFEVRLNGEPIDPLMVLP